MTLIDIRSNLIFLTIQNIVHLMYTVYLFLLLYACIYVGQLFAVLCVKVYSIGADKQKKQRNLEERQIHKKTYLNIKSRFDNWERDLLELGLAVATW